MRDQQARQILQALVNGIDPFTEEDLAAGTVLQNAAVMRAMLAGCSALDDRTARASRRSQQPRNIGKAWAPEEQEQLVQAFKSGEDLEQVAARHGRTIRGIEARLEILGMLTSEQRTTENRFGNNQRDDGAGGAARKSRAQTKKA
jgi:DNA-binding NarL/FixJ family response regulator